jgi:hypothetical protein
MAYQHGCTFPGTLMSESLEGCETLDKLSPCAEAPGRESIWESGGVYSWSSTLPYPSRPGRMLLAGSQSELVTVMADAPWLLHCVLYGIRAVTSGRAVRGSVSRRIYSSGISRKEIKTAAA